MLREILINVAATLAVAPLLASLPWLRRRVRYKAREDLLGTWHSSYQRYQKTGNHHPWVDEFLEIDVHGSKFRFRNRDNALEDYYVAHATLHEGELIGTWESVRRAAYASGSLVFVVRPMGGVLYGYFTGPRDNGERVYGAWVLGKTRDDIAAGKALIAGQTIPCGPVGSAPP